MVRLGVFASGEGSNLQAILDACREGRIAAEVALVLSDVPGAHALERAARAGVPAALLDRRGFASRKAFEEQALGRLREAGIGLVCLAGFLRLLSPRFVRALPGRILNVHPALLPAFPGLHAPRRALEAGAATSGCTVHFVDEGIDTGPILMQASVPVLAGDDEASLAARIREREHLVYPACIDLVARGRARLEGRRVRLDGTEVTDPAGVRLGENGRR